MGVLGIFKEICIMGIHSEREVQAVPMTFKRRWTDEAIRALVDQDKGLIDPRI